MGRIILIALAVLAAFIIVSAVISALHVLFWIAIVVFLVVAALRLTSAGRRWSRR